jgi:hypothetical protein
MQAVADTMFYSSQDSVLTLNYLPVLWFKQSQMSGKKVWIYFSGTSIKSIHIPENVFMCDKADSTHFTQLKGKELWAYFKKDTLQKIDITGNVQGVYYLQNEKKKLLGANIIESASVKLFSSGKAIDRVLFIKAPKGKIIPMKDVKPKELELKGFSWQIERKPKSKEDLLNEKKDEIQIPKEEIKTKKNPVKKVKTKKK